LARCYESIDFSNLRSNVHQAEALTLLKPIPYAPTRAEAERPRDAFAKRYRRWYPKAVASLASDWERLVTFYAFPEPHWKHLRTTNVVESPFAAVRFRTSAAKRFKQVVINRTQFLWTLV
jgi:putative transposase